jgi:hypothetical protein
MDVDTLILIILTSAAVAWFLALRINETRRYAKERALEEQKDQARRERMKELTKKL